MRLAALVVLLSALGAAAGWVWFERALEARTSAPLRVVVEDSIEVSRGMRLGDLVAWLQQRGMTSDGWWIRRYAIRSGLDKRLQAGEYRILPGDSARTLLERIARGDVIRRRFTIVEGWTVAQMLVALRDARLSNTPGLTGGNLSAELGIAHANPEGLFLPDTYDYVRSDKDLDVLRRAHDAMQRILAELWEKRRRDLPYADAYAALIVASMVEKETGVASDRPLIASVFAGRLRAGMKLQSDPTVIYGLGEAFDGNLTRAHLETPTPYNTYAIAALPPTPIALPGRDALVAVFQPPQTGYLYFVGRGDGTSQFSATLADHNKAVNTYQRGGGR